MDAIKALMKQRDREKRQIFWNSGLRTCQTERAEKAIRATTPGITTETVIGATTIAEIEIEASTGVRKTAATVTTEIEVSTEEETTEIGIGVTTEEGTIKWGL